MGLELAAVIPAVGSGGPACDSGLSIVKIIDLNSCALDLLAAEIGLGEDDLFIGNEFVLDLDGDNIGAVILALSGDLEAILCRRMRRNGLHPALTVNAEGVGIGQLHIAGGLNGLFENIITLGKSNGSALLGKSQALACVVGDGELVGGGDILAFAVNLADNCNCFLLVLVSSISQSDLSIAVFIIVSLGNVNGEAVGGLVDDYLSLHQGDVVAVLILEYYLVALGIKIRLFNNTEGNGGGDDLVLDVAGLVGIVVGSLTEGILSGSQSEGPESRTGELLGACPALNYLTFFVEDLDICALDLSRTGDIGLVDTELCGAAGHILKEEVPLAGVVEYVTVGDEPSGGCSAYYALGGVLREQEDTGGGIKYNVLCGGKVPDEVSGNVLVEPAVLAALEKRILVRRRSGILLTAGGAVRIDLLNIELLESDVGLLRIIEDDGLILSDPQSQIAGSDIIGNSICIHIEGSVGSIIGGVDKDLGGCGVDSGNIGFLSCQNSGDLLHLSDVGLDDGICHGSRILDDLSRKGSLDLDAIFLVNVNNSSQLAALLTDINGTLIVGGIESRVEIAERSGSVARIIADLISKLYEIGDVEVAAETSRKVGLYSIAAGLVIVYSEVALDVVALLKSVGSDTIIYTGAEYRLVIVLLLSLGEHLEGDRILYDCLMGIRGILVGGVGYELGAVENGALAQHRAGVLIKLFQTLFLTEEDARLDSFGLAGIETVVGRIAVAVQP